MKKFLPEIVLCIELIIAFIIFKYNSLVSLFCFILAPIVYGKMLDISERKTDRN